MNMLEWFYAVLARLANVWRNLPATLTEAVSVTLYLYAHKESYQVRWKVTFQKCLMSACVQTQIYHQSPKILRETIFFAGPSSTASAAEGSPVPLTSEELKKQKLTLKIQQEYFAALKHEGMFLFGVDRSS